MEKAWDNSSMARGKVKSKKDVIKEAQKNNNKVHFASLMDLCHLKNSELEPQFQKYQGRFVLRGDIVKDDSGACAVFTEQGSSALQVTAAKVMNGCFCKITRLWRTSSRCSICLHSGYPPILEACRPLHRHHRTRREEKWKQPLETVSNLRQVHLQVQY